MNPIDESPIQSVPVQTAASEQPVATPELPTVKELSGLDEGQVIKTPVNEPDEKIVADKDVNGEVIGWHKEPVGGTA